MISSDYGPIESKFETRGEKERMKRFDRLLQHCSNEKGCSTFSSGKECHVPINVNNTCRDEFGFLLQRSSSSTSRARDILSPSVPSLPPPLPRFNLRSRADTKSLTDEVQVYRPNGADGYPPPGRPLCPTSSPSPLVPEFQLIQVNRPPNTVPLPLLLRFRQAGFSTDVARCREPPNGDAASRTRGARLRAKGAREKEGRSGPALDRSSDADGSA